MIEQRLRFLLSTDQNRRATQTKLLSGLAEQPAEFNPRLTQQLRRLVTANVSEQLQFSCSTPTSKHQGTNTWRAV